MTEAEAEELAVRKRRAEGTPVTKETFESWKEKFQKEMEEEKAQAVIAAQKVTEKKGKKEGEIRLFRDGDMPGFYFILFYYVLTNYIYYIFKNN